MMLSAIFANGLSAPQHSIYLVILLECRFRVGGPPGVANPESPGILSFSGGISSFNAALSSVVFAFPFITSALPF